MMPAEGFEEAAGSLAEKIRRSVAGSVEGEEKVAVSFSGGLDSSILVACAKDLCEVVACTGFAPGSRDASGAKEAAAALGVSIVTTELSRNNVDDALSKMDVPFQPTPMDRSLWCLYSIVSQTARSSGARVMLLGQLADELFGGYAKYAEALERGGAESAKTLMARDAGEYSLRGRVRDLLACAPWVEARFPFEADEIRTYASALPVSYKISGGVRKAVLRKAALALGVPRELAGAPKKAAQYSSGVQKLVVGSHF
jgi:asparagine synthase (glutamine-hydrolysing)